MVRRLLFLFIYVSSIIFSVYLFIPHEVLPHVLLSLAPGLGEEHHDEHGPQQADSTKEEVGVVCVQ